MRKRWGTSLFLLFCIFWVSNLSAAGIGSKEFLSSHFIKSFRKKEYKKALQESDLLLKEHPRDPLILRYRALTLEKLHAPRKAIRLYQEILAAHPNDIPARLFLGLAYAKQNEYEKGARQLRLVSQHASSKKYRHWAQAQLSRLRKNMHAEAEIKKKVYVLGVVGAAYDSNPLLVPNNVGLRSQNKVAAALFPIELNVGYPLWLKRNFRTDIIYVGEEYFYTKGATQEDFISQGLAFDVKQRTFIGKRSVLWTGRYDFRINFLDNSFFSVVNRLFASADVSFWRKTQTHFYGRFGVLNYGSEGANPNRSSPQGVRGGFGMTQYFYSSSYKTFFFIKGEGNFNQTQGDNFNRRGALGRIGLHTPFVLLRKTDFDLSAGADWGVYPDFQSLSALDTNVREDRRWDIYTDITHHWRQNLATRLFYRFIDSQNDNAFFNRTRQVTGVKVIFSL